MSIEYIKTKGLHHCFFQSLYKEDDYDEDWNKFRLSKEDHDFTVGAGNDRDIERGKAVIKRCMEIAIARYPKDGKYLHKLVIIMKNRFGNNYIGFEKYGRTTKTNN